MHSKKRRHISPESRRDREKDKRPVIIVWVNDDGGLSRALGRLFEVRILIYAALRRECQLPGADVVGDADAS